MLAEAGVLAGQEATTHWAYVPLFRDHYPDVTLRTERILVQTGEEQNLFCAGGASSWQDLALLLVANTAAPKKPSGCPSSSSISGIATVSFRISR